MQSDAGKVIHNKCMELARTVPVLVVGWGLRPCLTQVKWPEVWRPCGYAGYLTDQLRPPNARLNHWSYTACAAVIAVWLELDFQRPRPIVRRQHPRWHGVEEPCAAGRVAGLRAIRIRVCR